MNGDESTLGQFASQSALNPAGLGADLTLTLTTALHIAGALIFVAVMGALAWAWFRTTGARTWWLWAGGVAAPAVALVVLVVGSTLTLAAIRAGGENATIIDVRGYQFWWDVTYDPTGDPVRDGNEVFLPLGEPVTFRLTSEDVIHSFWIPSISGKMDMIPGRVNELTVTAHELGRFRGQCAEFCGLSHPLMAFEVVVVPPDDFRAFVADLREEARDPDTIALREGRDVFMNAGCAACHAIRGEAEGGVLGPDLSRVGARASLGAGMWPMNVGNLAGWIADVQDMKPGANMPSYNHLTGPELRAVAHYLDSLE
ncbi:cytochrome c oxidase subunit II [Pseudaestuariivita sp.]|uniref:cytochrome c oxidase subunit II n=1 Tax=Pseudaestuariivita sp. TaxID=2211669 RepID=UPI0040585D2A